VIPPLQVVTGKGGVGKSTFAAVLAVRAARAGQRVLAIELGKPAGMADLLGVRPEQHGVPVPAGPGLHLAYFDGEQALAEYLRRRLPFAGQMNAVFAHPVYRAFVGVGPGVRELMAIGKVRDELLGLSSGGPQWDLIVLDAGASGHALQTLGMPAATARAFVSGLAHREAVRVAKTLADPRYTAVHVVARPEHMPLAEAGEIVERMRGDLGLPVGRLVINQCRPLAPPGTRAAVARLAAAGGAGSAQAGLAAVARRALDWLVLQEDGIAALEERVALTAERLPRLTTPIFRRAEIETLAGVLS
jgi:anion-transporting  ArsA/GET3 family ATPase